MFLLGVPVSSQKPEKCKLGYQRLLIACTAGVNLSLNGFLSQGVPLISAGIGLSPVCV